jgi:hypothetical protein
VFASANRIPTEPPNSTITNQRISYLPFPRDLETMKYTPPAATFPLEAIADIDRTVRKVRKVDMNAISSVLDIPPTPTIQLFL